METASKEKEMGNQEVSEIQPKVAGTRRGVVEYAEYGEGPAVVTLHGAMGGCDQSLMLAQTIGDDSGYRYIGVSRPGYLGTPISSGRSAEDQADLCAALLDELGIETAAVMAVSGGGPCALNFALRHGDRCRGLVLVSTCGARIDTPIPFAFKMMSVLVRIPRFAKSIERNAAASRDRSVMRCIEDREIRERTLADPEAGPLLMDLIASTSHRMAERMPGTLNDIATTRANCYPIEKIDAPTIIVHGTADKMVPYEVHAKALSLIPNAELLTVEGGEHVSIFTHRSMVKPRVVEFLRTHAG